MINVASIPSISGLVALALAVGLLGCCPQVIVDGGELSPAGPVVAANPRRIVQISGNGANTCARRADGSVACWGEAFGAAPQEIGGVTGAVEVRVGTAFACALGADGHVDCWTQPWLGAAGAPEPVPGLTDAVQLTAGADHACALRAGGGAVCWGSNFVLACWGALPSTTADAAVLEATPIEGLDEVVDVTGGWGYLCALDRGGRVSCWGDNEWFQLGDGTTTARDSPVPVLGL